VRSLLDECVDQRFRRDLVGHEVITVQEAGWAGKKNGELLALAAKTFQHCSPRSAARTNRLADLRPLAKDVLLELSILKPGQVSIIPKKSR